MNHKACQNLRDSISALVMGELGPVEAESLRSHLETCPGCRRVRDAMAAEEQAVRAGFEVLARSLGQVERNLGDVLDEPPQQLRLCGRAATQTPSKGRLTMLLAHNKRLASAIAAAVLVAVAGLAWLTLVPVSRAYAIEQTSQASRVVRNYHTRITPSGGGVGEIWAQLDESGELIRLRCDFPQTEDGPKVTFWERQKASVWFKRKNTYLTVDEPDMLAQFKGLFVMIDPKLAFERLETARNEGEVLVQTTEPAQDGQPIEVTVTSKGTPDKREVWLVDEKSKLVEQMTKHEWVDGQWRETVNYEYLDYNEPMPSEIWQPELPAEIVRIDQTTQAIGLSRGDLSEDEIAVKVARAFFEALIAKDYGKAGQILEGIPAAKIEEGFGQASFIRIVEIGDPYPDSTPGTQFLIVPVKVEIETNGQTFTKDYAPGIRPAYNQPGRWVIGGHI
jgi:putative zinc finger protein